MNKIENSFQLEPHQFEYEYEYDIYTQYSLTILFHKLYRFQYFCFVHQKTRNAQADWVRYWFMKNFRKFTMVEIACAAIHNGERR